LIKSSFGAVGADYECSVRQTCRNRLGLVKEEERFGWHRFRDSLCTWANEATKDIAVSQTMLRRAKQGERDDKLRALPLCISPSQRSDVHTLTA